MADSKKIERELKTKKGDGKKSSMQQEFERRKVAEKKAHFIVEQLIDINLDEDFFLSSLKLISLDHYKDVTEERFISGQCGYCLCQNKIKGVLKKQYKISQNRVFDITERKKFCSDKCFSISQAISDQISSTPIWLRDISRIADIKLDTELPRQCPGEEILIRQVISKKEVQELSKEESQIEMKTKSNQVKIRQQNLQHVEKPKTNMKVECIADSVLGILQEWLTQSSLQYLGIISDQDSAQETGITNSPNKDIKEKEPALHNQVDRSLLGSSCTESTKPLPDYKSLKSDMENYEDKVAVFFNSSAPIREKTSIKNNCEKQSKNDDLNEPVLPTLDSKNQINIRRNIVLDRIVKTIVSLSLPLHLSTSYIAQECRKLINTFTFKNTNVMLSSEKWPIVALTILHLIAMASPQMEASLNSREVTLNLEMLLKAYNVQLPSFKEKINSLVNKEMT